MVKKLEFIKYDEKYAEQCHNNFLCQKETAKYTLWRPTENIEEAKSKLDYWTRYLKTNDIFWLIKEEKSNQIVGFICAEETSPLVYDNIGIVIGRAFIKRGYGTLALSELINTFKQRGAKEVYYSHLEGNDASKSLALKFGFKFYKKDKRVRKYDNKEFDELFYVLNLDKIS